MIAVIFKAKLRQGVAQDAAYLDAAAQMRNRAFDRYRCQDFVSVCQDDQELTISYWLDHESIKAWKADPQHQKMQSLGRAQWYASYQTQITQIIHDNGPSQ